MDKNEAILEKLKGKWISQCERCGEYYEADISGIYDTKQACWFICECNGQDRVPNVRKETTCNVWLDER